MNRPSPSPGDAVVGCIHEPDPYGCHVFQLEGGLTFKRPDGSSGYATWIFLCNDCHARFAETPSKAPFGCDMVWPDDAEPIHYVEPS